VGGYFGGYAIKTNGTLYAWGTNLDYLSAQGTVSGETTTPTQVGSDTNWEFAMSSFESGTIAAAVGLKGGRPVSWGDNANGTTGQNTSTGTTTAPTALSNFTSATNWTSIAIGSSSCGGIGGGTLYSWGSNAGYRTGRNTNVGFTTTATQVGSETDWSQTSQSNLHGVGLRANRMFAWGSNANGRTGQGTTSGTTNTPAQVGSQTDWKKLGIIQINATHTAGIKG
jgi:alpha-tubulin suppressor-like RCC1 family protein